MPSEKGKNRRVRASYWPGTDQVAVFGAVHVNEGALQMSGAAMVPQRITESQQLFGRAWLARALYVAAVILATCGCLWLIASTAMKFPDAGL
jgi:hypothetical protein